MEDPTANSVAVDIAIRCTWRTNASSSDDDDDDDDDGDGIVVVITTSKILIQLIKDTINATCQANPQRAVEEEDSVVVVIVAFLGMGVAVKVAVAVAVVFLVEGVWRRLVPVVSRLPRGVANFDAALIVVVVVVVVVVSFWFLTSWPILLLLLLLLLLPPFPLFLEWMLLFMVYMI